MSSPVHEDSLALALENAMQRECNGLYSTHSQHFTLQMSPPQPSHPIEHTVLVLQTFYTAKSNYKTEQQRQQSVGVAQSGC